jgi:hypothetical protein
MKDSDRRALYHYISSVVIIVLLLLSAPVFSFIKVNSHNVQAQVSSSVSSISSTTTTINNNKIIKKGAYLDQVNFLHYLDENLAIQDLKAGKIDTYFFNIPPSVVSDIKNDPNLNAYES